MADFAGIIRQSPSGEELQGENDGDTLIWNAALSVWEAGPGGGGAVDSVFGRSGDVVAQAGDYSSDQVTNGSEWDGSNVTEALNEVQSRFTNLTSTQIANASGVAGPSVSDALDTLNVEIAAVAGTIGALTSDDIANASTVAGGTVTEALDALASGRRLLGVARRVTAGAETIACPAGTRAVLVRMGGGGAGGGHGAFAAAASFGAGGGGGSGAEQDFLYTAGSDIASVDVNCGSAGNAGTVGVSGGTGGNTTVTINGETFTSNGGTGSNNASSNTATAGQTRPGGAPGANNFQTGSNFTLLRTSGGNAGSNGSSSGGSLFAIGGSGGASSFGGGGLGTADGVGGTATGNCSGGGGGGASNGVSRNGGPGAPGAVILYFFSA